MRSIVLTLLCLTFIGREGVYGRAVKYWYPDELTDKSTLVCDGLVLDITALEHKEWKKSNGEIEPVRVYSANIKVFFVLKGKRVDTVEMRYGLMESDEMVFNGPSEISLSKGSKRRFYLNKDAKENYYWGCLQGELDDDQSVGPILVPNSPEDAKLRVNELMHGCEDVEHFYDNAMDVQGKPGYEEARDSVVSKSLKLVLMCESLKKADTDQKQVKATEEFCIQQLAEWKDSLFPDPNDTARFDALINQYLPDEAIRAYVTQELIKQWDHPSH